MTIYESMLASYKREGGSTATPNAEQEVCQKIVLAGLRERLSTTNIDNVKQDVLPYIDSTQQEGLSIWSNAYFLQLVDLMKVQQ